MRRRMHRRWHTVSLMAALSCVFMTACVKWPDAEVSATQHDKLLFERARLPWSKAALLLRT
jgi:hypothetical protein